MESAGFALGLWCAGCCSNRPVRPLIRTRRRRRATGRGTKRGICQARRWPVAPRARAAGSPTAATQRTEDRAPFASLSDLSEEQHRKARRCSQQATWHRGARRSQAGSYHRARRGIFSGPLAVGRSRELAPRPPTVSCSSNHSELHVAFQNDVACAEHETLQPKPLKSRIPVRENGTVDKKFASVGRWGVFMW